MAKEKLTKLQVERLQERINAIVNRVVIAHQESFPKIPEKMTFEQRYAEIKSGKAKLRPISELRGGYNQGLGSEFVFETEVKKAELRKKIMISVAALRSKLEAKARSFVDRVVLGGEDAIAVIEEFEKFTQLLKA